MRDPSLQHVGNRKDTCFNEDVIACNTYWLTSPINAFTMLQHYPRNRPRKGCFFPYAMPDLGMYDVC